MPQRRSHVAPSAAQTDLASALAALRESMDAPLDFPDDVIAEAEAATTVVPELDLREIPFATLDPEGSRDLDQAFHLERAGTGYTVRYAIADVPGFVVPVEPWTSRRAGEDRPCTPPTARSRSTRAC